jgi:hypothetical protein
MVMVIEVNSFNYFLKLSFGLSRTGTGINSARSTVDGSLAVMVATAIKPIKSKQIKNMML